jgi:hypothetical protein
MYIGYYTSKNPLLKKALLTDNLQGVEETAAGLSACE